MIKRGPGIDPQLQLNKADNIRLACSRMNGVIVNPGETFSFWKLVGKTSKRNGFAEGRVIVNGKLVAGVGGGLCNLANTINLLVMHSPMTITELHHHSDALAPPVQLCAWCDGDDLCTELRTTMEFPTTYRLVEEDHHFHQEASGNYYRISKIYLETMDRTTGEVLERRLQWDNRSRVMFDPALIPAEQIR